MEPSHGAAEIPAVREVDTVVDEPSIIHLLRVFVGAAQLPVAPWTARQCGQYPSAPLQGQKLSPSRKRPREEDLAPTLPWQTREEAGCTLWDLSVAEVHASRMISAGLLPVAGTVLRHCAQAEADKSEGACERSVEAGAGLSSKTGVKSDSSRAESAMHHGEAKLSEELDSSSRRKNDFCARSGGLDVGPKGEFTESEATEFSGASKPPVRLKLGTEHALGEGARVGTEATRCRDKIQVEPGWEIENEWGVVPAAISKSDGVVRLKEDEAVRLREITCGLLANACTHRNLRQRISSDKALGAELLQAFYSSDDPACLTEILRLFASAVGSFGAGGKGGGGEAEEGELRAGVLAKETLERLVFFLENSLDEKLLARACSLVYTLMYRCGDEVIFPLVQLFGVERALASLLDTRRNDLSFDQIGGAETGLDALLRCLEVLSTNENSCIGPSTEEELPPAGPPRSTSGTSPSGADEDRSVGDKPENTHDFSEPAGGVRNSIIRGLVAALMPWEHSRRSQEAALLVLGNILDNVLENVPEKLLDGSSVQAASATQGFERGGGPWVQVARDCGKAMEDALVAQDKADGGGELHDGRLAVAMKGFLDNISSLTDAQKSSEDGGLRSQLQEASALVERALQCRPQ